MTCLNYTPSYPAPQPLSGVGSPLVVNLKVLPGLKFVASIDQRSFFVPRCPEPARVRWVSGVGRAEADEPSCPRGVFRLAPARSRLAAVLLSA